jgi:hypothetical protein
MKANAQTFFNFCAGHVPLLRRLAERAGEVSEAEVVRVIRQHAQVHEELPETTWRRLLELQILLPTEPGGSLYLVAEPVGRLLTYLFDEANPATPEMVRGYIASLEALGKKLGRAIETDDVTFVGLAFGEINASLRRSSFIAVGAAVTLERLQREGISNWGAAFVISLCQLRLQDVPGDQAIASVLRRVIKHPPEPAPVVALDPAPETPPALVRRLWLDQLPAAIQTVLPVDDLLQWMAGQYPSKSTGEIMAGFSRLLFDDHFRANFAEDAARTYMTADGQIESHPLRLEHA